MHLIICFAETDAMHTWSKYLPSAWQYEQKSIGLHLQLTQLQLCADRLRLSLF